MLAEILGVSLFIIHGRLLLTYALLGVVGWSIGNGWLTLLTPVMFNAINEKTLYVFGACNVLSIPFVWAFYPETNQRTLEEMDLLFSADSVFAWEAEKVSLHVRFMLNVRANHPPHHRRF